MPPHANYANMRSMDGNKDSLGGFGSTEIQNAQNTNISSAPVRTAPAQSASESASPHSAQTMPAQSSTPAQSQSAVTPDSGSSSQVITSVGLPTATPLNAPLPTDPLHPTYTTASGDGDIVIGGKKISKKPLIIGAIIAAVVAIIIILVIAFSGKSSVSLDQAFITYHNYLKYGTAKKEENASNEDWYLFEAKSLLSDSEYADYIAKLRESSDMFVTALETVNAENQELFFQEAKTQREELEYIILMLNLDDLEAEVREKYSNNGKTAASTFVEEKTGVGSYSDIILAAYSALREYLDSEVTLLGSYSDLGCTKDGYVDLGCVAELDDAQSETIAANEADFQIYSYNNLMSVYDEIKSSFQSSVNDFNDEIGSGSNA